MIYFVDEDVAYAKEFSVPLILRGYEVKIISNADNAFEILENADDVQLAIIDIMLATASAEKSRFTADETDSFLKTGLLLMAYLNDKRRDVYPERFVVLTAASQPRLVNEIRQTCKDMGVPVLRKTDYRRPANLADELIKKIGNR